MQIRSSVALTLSRTPHQIQVVCSESQKHGCSVQPPSPGLRVTLPVVSTCFIGIVNIIPVFQHAAFGRLVRTLEESGCTAVRRSLVFHPQQLVIIFRSAVCHFSRCNTSTLRCCMQWSKFGEIRPKATPRRTFALHSRTATASYKPPQPAKLRHAPDG